MISKDEFWKEMNNYLDHATSVIDSMVKIKITRLYYDINESKRKEFWESWLEAIK